MGQPRLCGERPAHSVRANHSIRRHTRPAPRTATFDATIGPTLGGGCHTSRDTAAAIQATGFTIDHLDPFRFPDTRLTMPATPHLRGTATRNP